MQPSLSYPFDQLAVPKIAVIGLGYVGLPLAVAFGTRYDTLGFDVNSEKIAELVRAVDIRGEVSEAAIKSAEKLNFSNEATALRDCNVFIIAVPTPVDSSHGPDLGPLLKASEIVGHAITPGSVVVYESTVYPGCTEEDCIPIIERISGLELNCGFFAGYSPERLNPGDKSHPLTSIMKITSGSSTDAAHYVDWLYKEIIEAGTFPASSIRVAEAAKVVENVQRDVNLALINELSIIFDHLNIDTHDVLAAASTKWNFISLKPGLVGGHCISIDPYYLLHKSASSGYIPDIIRSAREINENMAGNAAARLVKLMIRKNLKVHGASILLVGFTFKKNCKDIRNTKAFDLYSALSEYGMQIDVVDSWAEPAEVGTVYGVDLLHDLPQGKTYDAVVLAVPHDNIVAEGPSALRSLLSEDGLLFDLMAAFDKRDSDLRL